MALGTKNLQKVSEGCFRKVLTPNKDFYRKEQSDPLIKYFLKVLMNEN